jgi:arabinose-5-phosphate isomerase
MIHPDLVGIGTVVVDRVRHTPRFIQPGNKCVTQAPKMFPGGVVLNHLAWAAAMGLRSGLLARLGRDDGGLYLRREMPRFGIATDWVLDAGEEPTGVSEVLAGPGGERAIYTFPGTTLSTTPAQVRRHWREVLGASAMVSSEISMMPLATVWEAFRLARGRRALDFDVPPAQATAHGGVGTEAQVRRVVMMADILKGTLDAAETFTGTSGLAASTLALARLGRRRIAAVTDGARGSAVSDGRRVWIAPSFPRRGVDATGAGDAFFGSFLAGLSQGLSPREASRLGNACGAVCVETVGAFPPPKVREKIETLFGDAKRLATHQMPEAQAKGETPASRLLKGVARSLRETAEHASGMAPAVDLLAGRVRRGGRLHLCGVGKTSFVAARAAATLCSWGIPAYPLDATNALHGDLGQVAPGDAALAVSKSGETRELLHVVAALKARGIPVVAVTGAGSSRLARAADCVVLHPEVPEGGPWDLAPMASLAAEAALLDALACESATALRKRSADFAANHPGGTLGRRATRMAQRGNASTAKGARGA